ncbi:MAG: hypothetical protein ABIG61_13835 [Planctomycetota bacterium]
MAGEEDFERLDLSGVGTIDKAVESSKTYMNRLIVVAMAANELVEGAKKSERYYIKVTKQRFNVLRQALEMLRKQR